MIHYLGLYHYVVIRLKQNLLIYLAQLEDHILPLQYPMKDDNDDHDDDENFVVDFGHEEVDAPDTNNKDNPDNDCNSENRDAATLPSPSVVDHEESLQNITNRFLLKIGHENALSHKLTRSIAQNTCSLISATVTQLKRKIKDCMEDVNVDTDTVPGFEDAFAEIDDVCNFIKTTSTTVNFDQLCDDEDITYVEPVKRVIGKHRAVRKINQKKKVVEIEDAFYYIPILESLQQQLSSPKMLDLVLNTAALKSRDKTVLKDFCDGSIFKEHPLFANDEKALQILLYYDDVRICNPLTNKPHKLSLFYYQIANIPPVYRSKLQSVKLFAVCSYTTFKKYKEEVMNKILKSLDSALRVLGSDDGYSFDLPNIGFVKMRGAVLAFLADTPASQCAGGFKEGVGGARCKCRHCMVTFASMQIFFEEEMFELRDLESYLEQLSEIENAPSNYLKKFFSKVYGINQKTVLSDFPYFNVCNQLPQDIMHVFLEGILQYEFKLFLTYLINDQKSLSLKELNTAIQNFPLGYSDAKNRPIAIKNEDLEQSSSTNLGQTASRMWLLSQILPFILEKYVDMSSPHWEILMSLNEIMSLTFSTEIELASIPYLKYLIKEHLSKFKQVYNANIIPKQHYLVHLPSQILKFGPLIRCWCMRFEGKHAYFKDLAKKIRNFKNLPFSLATRSQQMECAHFIQVDKNKPELNPMFKDDVNLGHYKVLQGNEESEAKDLILSFFGINLNLTVQCHIFECSQIEIHGTKYKPGKNNFLLFHNEEGGLPQFGVIKKIWSTNDCGCFFKIKVAETVCYDEYFNAFKIDSKENYNDYELISQPFLRDYHVYHAYKSEKGEQFIVCKGGIPST